MKTIKKITVYFFAFLLAFTSCQNKKETNDFPFYQHCLMVSFQDASGNDLVKGIGFDWSQPEGMVITEEEAGGTVKPDLYTLEIVFPEGFKNPWKPEPGHDVIFDKHEPALGYGWGCNYNWIGTAEICSYGYLFFETGSLKSWGDDPLPFAEKITFKLSCPYIFGNDVSKDIVTYWVCEHKNEFSAKCYRVEFDGKDYFPEEMIRVSDNVPDGILLSVVAVTVENK